MYRSKEVDEVYESKDFQDRALKNSLAIQQVDTNQYFAIYFTGGHGVLWDFPDNPQIERVVNEIYEKDGYVLSVCHGLAGLVHLKLKNQQYIISGKKITGFTNAEEVLSGKLKKVPFLTEKEAKKAGAYFVQKIPFMSHAVRDGRLITGQNPMSGHAVAKLLIESVGKQ